MKPTQLTIALLALVLVLAVVFLGGISGTDPASSAPGARSRTAAPSADLAGGVGDGGTKATALAEGAESGTGEGRAEVTTEEVPLTVATVTLHGRVQIPEGHGFDPRLRVYALEDPCRYQDFAASQGSPPDPIEPPSAVALRRRIDSAILARAPVNANGTFELEVPAGDRSVYLMLRGTYLYLESTERVVLDPEREALLEPAVGAWVHGRVVGPTGAAAAGAQVRLFDMTSDGTRGMGGQPGGFTHLTSAEGGTFEVLAAPCLRPYQWSARCEEFGGQRGDLGMLTPLTEVVHDLVLDAAGRVRGIVIEKSGDPVGGATVTAWLPGRIFGMDDEVVRQTTTDDKGAYDLMGLPIGTIKVTADHPEYLDTNPHKTETREGHAVEGLDLVLDAGRSIQGRLRSEAGAPVAGLTLRADFDVARVSGPNFMNGMRGGRARATTNELGEFVFKGLGAGPFVVEARDSREEAGEPIEWRARRDGVLPGGVPLELVLRPGLFLSGIVVDTDGAPVPAFSVVARQEAQGDFMSVTVGYQQATFANGDGSFALGNLTEGRWSVTVEGDGLVTSEPTLVDLPSDEATGLRLAVIHAATVRGRVLDPDGEPAVGAVVERAQASTGWQVETDYYPDELRAVSDEEGRYELTGVAPGELALVAKAPGFSRSAAATLELDPKELRENLDLRLTKGGTITGEVFAADGSAATGFMIMGFQMSDFSQLYSLTDGRGRFQVENVVPGMYMLVAMDPSQEIAVGEDGIDMASMMGQFKVAQATVKEGETTHVIIGAPPEQLVVVHGKVTLAGEGYGGALVSFVPPGERMYEAMRNTTVADDGSYRIELDGSGDYVVSIQVVSGAAGQQNTIEYALVVPQGAEEFEYDLELPLGRISGRLVGPDGDPAGGARVTLTFDGVVRTDAFFGGQYTEIATAADGTFDIRALRPGTYRLSAGGASPFSGAMQSDFGRTTTGNLVLGEDEWKENVVLRLPRPGTLNITVTGPGGQPVPGASIFVRDANGRMLEPFSMVVSDGSGRVSYGGIAPGEVTVSARSLGLTCAECDPVEVRENGATSVSLQLEGGTILWVVLRDKAGKPAAAAVSVKDEEGREVTGMFGMNDLQALYMEGQFSPHEHRLGPLPPGLYTVSAVIDGDHVEKNVRLKGEAEKRLAMRAR